MTLQPILELKNVSAAYGRIKAIKGISLKVYPGEVVSIIGANGAGKSTTLMAISSVLPITGGEICYDGVRIDGLAADLLPSRGLCQVPEGRRIFPRLTVEENLDMGAFFRKDRAGILHDLNRVFQLFPILQERRKQHGGTLSGGEQQMLAMGRALMSRPRLLLLDEPSLGLAPLIVQQIANLALQASTRGYVLETGNVIMEDEAGALLANPDIRKAYLGE